MIGCPHLLHGTVASGARSPGMNTFVSHELHVTIFNGLSLMLEVNLAPRRIPTMQFSPRNQFDKCAGMVFLLRVGYEHHDCSNTEARASQRIYVHLDARWLLFWHRGNELLI
jgi:hypothetical protein